MEFRPDTGNGYSYNDSLTVSWWESGDALSNEAPHRVEINGYVFKDASSGGQRPYTGKLVRDDNGNIRAAEGTEDFLNVWKPLLAAGNPFKNVTVLEGSVVLTLASSIDEMPAKTLVQVSFIPPEEDVVPEDITDPKDNDEPVKPVIPETPKTPDKTDTLPAPSVDEKKDEKNDKKKDGKKSESDDDESSSNDRASSGPLTWTTAPVKALTPVIPLTPVTGISGNEINEDTGVKGIRTGDDTPLYELRLLLVILLICLILVSGTYIYRKKAEKDKA